MWTRCLVLSALVAGSALAAPPEAKQRAAISTVLDSRFPKWDKNHDGKLSREEVDAVIANHSVTGDDAAAAAALHRYFRGQPAAEPLTRTFLNEAAMKTLPEERRDQALKAPHFQGDFNHFRNHLQKVPRDIFAGDAPHLLGMSQGALGDCYFVCVVGAAVEAHRDRLKQMFHLQKDGSCIINFLNGKTVTVHKLTDAQIALGSTAGDQGLWLNVLEQGYGQLHIAADSKKQEGDIPLDSIARGGDPGKSITLLTGHKTKSFEIAKHAKDSALIHNLREAMIAGTKSRLLMSSGTPHEKAGLPPGIADSHCYAVLGFDSGTNMVYMWNPWGNNFQPKMGSAGLANGYPTKDGHFDVKLAEFVKIFSYFDCETLESAHGALKKR